jgi:uncharacterized protein (DUF1697 family)
VRSLALLRGVNVGGNHQVAMNKLTAWLEEAGFTSVTTYIQSGNVIVNHRARRDVATAVREVITQHTGWDIPVIVRSAEEMRNIVGANPYPDAGPKELHVSFLDAVPDDAVLLTARADEWLPEEFTLNGREVYLHLPQGMGKSVMVPRLKLLKGATTRNWNTVLALNDMMQ